MGTPTASVSGLLHKYRSELLAGAACDKPDAGREELPAPKLVGLAPETREERRVVIAVDGDMRRLDLIRQAARTVDGLYQDHRVPPNMLHTRILWSMDDCLHGTQWGTSPSEVGDQTRAASCYQRKTKFADALTVCLDEILRDSRLIDAIVIVGDRCDDPLPQLIGLSKELSAWGTVIFAFDLGTNTKAQIGYEAMTQANKGSAYFRLSHEQSLPDVMGSLIDHLFRGNKALLAIRHDPNPDMKLLAARLERR